MSARPHVPLLPLALALAGVVVVACWRWARMESLGEAAALALALALWFAARRAGLAGALALALGVIAGDWLRPWAPARMPMPPGLEGASAAMVLLVFAWVIGRAAQATGSVRRSDGRDGTSDAAAAAASAPARTPADDEPASPIGVMPATPGERAGEAELVGQVAHELRTPLNAMAGWLHVLEAGAEFGEPTLAKARAGLRRSVVQQRDLIDAVDELSRASTGDLALARGPVEWGTMLERSVTLARELLVDGRAAALGALQAGPPIWVEADAERVTRVMVELLVSIARLRGPDATIQPAAGIEGGTAWASWTSPLGTDADGVTFEALLRERVEGHRQPGRSRPPLLAFRRARAIAALHGGMLTRVADGLHAGLRLELPLGIAQPETAAGTKAQGAAPGLHGLRLLVVDDQEEMREMLVALLGQQGARVSQADGAAGALDLIRGAGDDRFDLAVLDVAMPGEDGLSLVRRIRETERREGCAPMAAIALTAHASAALEREAMSCGFDAFLPKPLDPRRLVDTIRALRPAPRAA